MYAANSIAAISFVIVFVGLLLWEWPVTFLGTAGLILALYTAFVLERKTVAAPSTISQLALLAIGALVLAICYGKFTELIELAKAPDYSPFLVIGFFSMFAIFSVAGFVFVVCGLTSQKFSHKLLRYFVDGPSRLNKRR